MAAKLLDTKRYSLEVPAKKGRSKSWDDSATVKEFMVNERLANKFKNLVREGIPDELRYHERDYGRAVKSNGLDRLQNVRMAKFPTFGGAIPFDRLALTKDGEMVVKNILYILALEFPTLEYSPYLPVVVALLLHHVSADDTLACMRVMVKRSTESIELAYFPTKFNAVLAMYDAFGNLVNKHVPKVYKHMKKLQGDTSPFWITWLNNFCLDFLSLDASFRLMDAFLLEGYKVIFRYGVGAFILRGPEILKCKTIDAVVHLFEDQQFSARNDDDDKLSKAAYNFSFSRSEVTRVHQKLKEDETVGSVMPIDAIECVRLMPGLLSKSSFLTDEHWSYIWTWIPKRLKTTDVELLFTTDKHGYNLQSMYKQAATNDPQLMIVQTTDGSIFGAYLSEGWEDNVNGKFFGTAETFLFTLQPREEKYEWVGLTVKPDETERMQDIAVNASLFIFGNYKYMAVGGGGLHYGFTLDETLAKGTTGTCHTFNNKPLTGVRSTFEVRHLEVWKFK